MVVEIAKFKELDFRDKAPEERIISHIDIHVKSHIIYKY